MSSPAAFLNFNPSVAAATFVNVKTYSLPKSNQLYCMCQWVLVLLGSTNLSKYSLQNPPFNALNISGGISFSPAVFVDFSPCMAAATSVDVKTSFPKSLYPMYQWVLPSLGPTNL